MNGEHAMAVTHAPDTFRMTPARWLALVLGVPVALTMIAGLGFSSIANVGEASFPVDVRTIPVQHGQLSVSSGGGNLTVRPGAGDTGRLVGTVTYSLIRPDVSRTGADVSVHCSLLIGDCGLDATLSVPAATGVTLSSGGGDMDVAGLTRGADLSSDGGNVSVSSVAGTVSVRSGGGDLTATGLGGLLTFDTDGGNVNGTTLTSSQTTIQSGGGDVTLTFTKVPTNLSITSSGGNITVVLPYTRAGYNVSADPGGGNYSHSIGLSHSSLDDVTVDSGGGDINLTYPS
jgi:hypothetical protein